jgi:NAD-dependent deacetylase
MKAKKKPLLVVLTGAGMSAESGLQTFRDAGGLWEGHDIMEVASIAAWHKNPSLVIDFYNQRRAALALAKPNNGHLALAKLEEKVDVCIITQNVDDLHERAGSSLIVHLHGELVYACAENNKEQRTFIGYNPLALGQKNEHGTLLRPDIVWFGEAVPKVEEAINWVQKADYFWVIGTSLQVYPAASLLAYCPPSCACVYIDPKANEVYTPARFKTIAGNAATAVPALCNAVFP